MSRMDFIDIELERLKAEGMYNQIRTIESAQGAWIVIDGRKVLNLCSNNYLGLANDPRLKKKAAEALECWGVGPGAVRSIAGTMSLHDELERKLSAFKKREGTLSLQSGLLANVATIPALVDSAEDAIFTDELNHASIIDGVRLSRASRHIYRHSDADDLREQMKKAGSARRKLIITDGVFSMDGDVAPLPDLVRVAEEFDAMLMVDDAHGEGVLGSHGRGAADHFHLHQEVDIEIGTLSKAFGVMGGFVSGSGRLVEFLKQKARPFLFSSAMTPADVAACIAAVDVLSESDTAVKKLWANGDYLKKGLREAGFDTGVSTTPITPVMLGDADRARAFSRQLFEKGIFAMAIGFPTVARGKARIRCMVSAAHETADLDQAIQAFREVGKELGVGG
ncbi:MAG: glycine C-acetyltransferase [Candidatus Eisenbacteria bacterium]|nr:glycine C-acetyltransferase [Candidatus Eisenbacteria bacterium]